ncbi:MAG: Rne/Rng family ribonuclease [Ignavibacteria bacterium]|jgi:ribonuclease G|nr:Rne/Rng family ribonuclease [Ignavibacteria bacterium]MCU7512563.1 Rne/Rng family ribonuclease [Ignavibacteria bacterium]MCU7519660.1 Rne/Rng family ribonuclease [Ignavibacteria bacterium]
MVKEIIINSSSSQNRVAITEDGNLVDFFVDHPEKRRMVGDIYLGKVARILPGIKAAFIDIGMKHDAFLHFSDIGDRLEGLQSVLDDDSELEDVADDVAEHNAPARNTQQQVDAEVRREPFIPKLHKGQEILVQITKEPVGNKGVRVTSSISLPGRFCVLLPFDSKIGISKKIAEFRERRRLKSIAKGILPENCGLIIRTAAKEQSEESLSDDLKYLVKTWEEISAAAKTDTPPALLYQDLSTTSSVIRDLFTPDISKVFIDSRKLYKQIKSYVHLVQPALMDKIELFRENQSIFEAFKIDEAIKTLMGRKVPLPSGGYLIIDHTEAMVVVDVNSGRYAAKKEQELNSLKTDLEAAREVARQLRLRDIGGLIVCDFIDLEDEKNRKKIYDELKKEFRKDRAKVSVLPMTDFGLIQITRQRIRENILHTMNEVCPFCNGSGLLTKKSNLLHEIETWLKRFKSQSPEKFLVLNVHPSLGIKLREGRVKRLTKLQFKYFVKIKLVEDENFNPATFRFLSAKTGKDITAEFIG